MHDDPHAFPDFYRDTIGFEVRADAGHGGMRRMRGITAAPAGQPGVPMSRLPVHRQAGHPTGSM
jgi:hypothetical protein